MSQHKRNIIVVGGGPAGMMAAVRAAQLGHNVILIEKNPTLGKKLLISGKGRCNITNACDLDSFLRRFSKNGQFLRDAFKLFFNRELVRFFEARGLRLKTERQKRMFPVTDRADSVLAVLSDELRRTNVKVICRKQVIDILVNKKNILGVKFDDAAIGHADKVIVATGGISYGFTGSTGEGLCIAERMGHHIVRLRPGLVPFETRQRFPALLQGLALENIRLTLYCGKRSKRSEIGELLFTHFGISGPLIISLSKQISAWLENGRTVFITIDLKPALSEEMLHSRFLREFAGSPKKTIKNILSYMMPRKMIDVFIELAGINRAKKGNQITKPERERMIAQLKGLRLDIIRPRPIKGAMVTRGGISLKDINPRTMESRLIKGLYFAGEMIDVDADTGGFNIQAAFSTGYLAGECAALA